MTERERDMHRMIVIICLRQYALDDMHNTHLERLTHRNIKREKDLLYTTGNFGYKMT